MARRRAIGSTMTLARLILAAVLLLQFALLGRAHLAPTAGALATTAVLEHSDCPGHGAATAAAVHHHPVPHHGGAPADPHGPEAAHCPFYLAGGGVHLPPPPDILLPAESVERIAFTANPQASGTVRPAALPPPSRAPPLPT